MLNAVSRPTTALAVRREAARKAAVFVAKSSPLNGRSIPSTTPNRQIRSPVNPTNRGVIPVALFATSEFDVSKLDSDSVRFGRTGTEASLVRFALEDVNGDGRADLVYQFATERTGIQCGDHQATLTGRIRDHTKIKGVDSIRTTGCR